MLTDLLTVVIVCYDPYVDAIKFSHYFLNKNWNNRTANVLYVSGNVVIDDYGHESITTGGDLSFSCRLLTALKNVKTKYLLILLDDYLIDANVNEKLLMDNILFMDDKKISFCELCTIFRRPKGKKVSKGFLKTAKSVRYRLNLQPTIFAKDILFELLNMSPNTPWDAEMCLMDKRFDKYDAYFALNQSFHVVNYIDKGMVTRKAYKMLKKEHIWKNDRQVMPVYKGAINYFKGLISFFVPGCIKNKIKGNKVVFK